MIAAGRLRVTLSMINPFPIFNYGKFILTYTNAITAPNSQNIKKLLTLELSQYHKHGSTS